MKRIIFAAIIAAAVCPLAAGGYYDQGISYYRSKNYVKAKDALQKEVESHPSNGMAWYFLGEVCKNINDYQTAEDAYLNAVKNPIQRKYLSLAYWNLLVIVEQKNDVGEIIRVCREFWLSTGDDGAKRKVDDIINKMIWSDNQQALDLYKEGCALRDQRKTNDARQKFSDAVSADNSFLAPRFELGQILLSEGKPTEAASHFAAIAEKVPYYGGVNLLLGEIYYNDKSFQKSADCFEKTIQFGFLDRGTRFSSYLKLASCHLALRNYEKAEAAVDQALKINGSDREALMLMSAIDIKLDRYNDALKTLTKLQSIDPNNADVVYQIGSIYYRQQNTAKYIKAFDQLLDLSTKGGTQIPQKYVKAMNILIKAHAAAGSHGKVAEIYSVLPDTARDTETNLTAAKAYMQIRRYDAAIPLFEKLSLSHDDRFILCQAYAKNNMKQKAKSSLSDLIRVNQSYSAKALSDAALAPVAKEIAADEQKARELQEKQTQKQQQTQAPQKAVQPSPPANQSPAPYDATQFGQ